MKRLITQITTLAIFLVVTIGNIISQEYLTVNNETTIELIKSNFDAYQYLTATNNWTDRTSCNITSTFFNMSSAGRIMTIKVNNVSNFDLQVHNSTAGRTFKLTIGSGSEQIITHSGANCELFSFSTNDQTGDITIKLEGGGASVYPAIITLYPPATPSSPTITAFSALGENATIDEEAKTITAELPYGTNLTSIEPVVTIGGSATGYTPSGAQDFSAGAVTYTVTDGTTSVDYAVTLTASTVASDEKEITNLKIGGKTPAYDSENKAYSILLPKGTSLSQAVTFDIPTTASADFTSGNTHDFANPLTITVTAQDNSTQVYSVSATIASTNVAYVINTAISAKDTKIYPSLIDKGYYVELIPIANINTTYDWSTYDLVVMTEAPSSGSAGMKALWGINKPLLALKIYALNTNTWDKGTPSNPNPAATQASIFEPNHPLFAGVATSGAYDINIDVFDAISTSNGMQLSNYSGNYLIGGIPGLAGSSIIEFPIGTESATAGVTNAALVDKLLVIGFADNNQDLLKTDGLKLVENACNYLMGSTIWGVDAGTQFKDIEFTGESSEVNATTATVSWSAVPAAVKYMVSVNGGDAIEVDGTETSEALTGLSSNTNYTVTVKAKNAAGAESITAASITFKTTISTGIETAEIKNIRLDGQIIHNNARQLVRVYNATGKLIASSTEDINLSAMAAGVYLVKSENGSLKIALTK